MVRALHLITDVKPKHCEIRGRFAHCTHTVMLLWEDNSMAALS